MTDPTSGWIAGGQTRGDRDEQEDFIVLARAGDDGAAALAVLCDGMGGRRGGAIASETVATTFADVFEPHDDVREALGAALGAANDALARQVRNNPYLRGLGTTLLAAHIAGDALHHVSVGDSILWLVRNGACRRVNADHSIAGIVENLRADGRNDEADDLAEFPASTLFSALTGENPPDSVDLPARPVTLEDGDVIVLASDGALSLDEDRIASILSERPGDAEAGVNAILDAVADAAVPAQDNTSLIVAAICREPQKDG